MTDTARPDLDLTISRIIRAPRPVVWRAWTDPASFEQWCPRAVAVPGRRHGTTPGRGVHDPDQ